MFSDKSLSSLEKKKVAVIFTVSFFVIFFWSAFEQAGASLTFFAEEQTNRDLGFYVVPSSFFQSLNSTFVVILAPIFAFLWLKMGKREPSSPTKMAMGLFLLALGYLWIAFGVKDVQPGVKVSMIWLTGMYFMHTSGELCLSPIGLSLVNKLAGVLSALYPDGKTTYVMGFAITNLNEYFMMFVVMAGTASIILFILASKLKKMMD